MPSSSQAQAKLMAAAAHNPKLADSLGIGQSMAKEWHKADKKRGWKQLPKRKGKATHAGPRSRR